MRYHMRCVLPRLIAVLGLTLFVLGPTLSLTAQREPDPLATGIPTPGNVMEAYSAVEAAVRAWTAPGGPLTTREGSTVGAVWGARVALRRHGKPIGTVSTVIYRAIQQLRRVISRTPKLMKELQLYLRLLVV